MVVVHLGGHVAAVPEEAEADVALQLVRAEHLGDRAGGLGAPHLELEEAVACGRVALREEEVVLGLGVDVVDAPAVADDLDGGLEAGDGEGGGGRVGDGRQLDRGGGLLRGGGCGREVECHTHGDQKTFGVEHSGGLFARLK